MTVPFFIGSILEKGEAIYGRIIRHQWSPKSLGSIATDSCADQFKAKSALVRKPT